MPTPDQFYLFGNQENAGSGVDKGQTRETIGCLIAYIAHNC